MSNNPQYWVVGATLYGHSAIKTFVNRGYWQLGKDSKPTRDILYMGRFAQITSGDRIAIKSLVGKGTAMMKVKVIGIVKDVVSEERRVYVDWVFSDVSREAALHGCMDAINGPYVPDERNKDWINEVFRI